MRVASYARISTDEEHQPHSLGAQRDRLGRYCDSQDGWRLLASYEDQITGTALARPGLDRALADARAGRFDLLLVYRVDRLARSVRTLAQVLAELDEAGVGFRSATEPFDTTNPAGRMMVQMLGVFAEFERATIIDRVVAGMDRKARSGAWVPGVPPIGFRRIAQTGYLEPDPAEAALVRRIFALYTERRLGTRAIAALLNSEGGRTKSRRLWAPAAIAVVLRNPVYVGRINWRGETHPGAHDALISEDTFTAAQTLLAERGANRSTRRSNSSDYLLSGLVRCEHCGSAMVGTAAHGNGGRYRYYSCRRRNRYGSGKGCAAARIPADALEDTMLAVLTDRLADTDLIERAVARAQEIAGDGRGRLDAELVGIDQELRRCTELHERYLAAFERGTMPEEACGDRLRSLSERSAQLEQHRLSLQDELAASTPAVLDQHMLAAAHASLSTGFADAPLPERKHILAKLVDRIDVRGREWIRPVVRIPVVRIEDEGVGCTGLEPVTPSLSSWCSPN